MEAEGGQHKGPGARPSRAPPQDPASSAKADRSPSSPPLSPLNSTITPKSCTECSQSLLCTRCPPVRWGPPPCRLRTISTSPGGSGPRMLLGGCSWPHTRASGQASPLPSPRLVLRPREPDGPSRPAQASPLCTLLGPQNPPVPLLRWRPLRGLGTAARILPLSTVTGGCQAQASRGPAQRRVPGRGACCTPPFPQGRPRSEVLVPPGRRRSLRPSGASSGRAARTAPAGVSGCFPGRAGKHFRQLSLCPLLSP